MLRLVNTIRQTVPTEKIMLFGSHAYGTPHKDSDYDLYVVLPDNEMRPLEAIQQIYGAFAGIRQRRPVDVLAGTRTTFNDRKRLNTLERKIDREGIVLYERS